ncbi:protein phosphatase regulator GAC1 [Sugiyamaella lignohabitans]|uniref:Protein phosphatase regulator GAC1 n=1 Tax=Sugiyamaella lignohabitans TaxID=796027 RepID=A0A161HI37_9ASCO|nr:protein phosphatase regulator GAC1 [Sugiyamaella lignohabitans]ANB12037.1 protein phosphatase regulator GAC1 [Sugiyamaella lignohabitans]
MIMLSRPSPVDSPASGSPSTSPSPASSSQQSGSASSTASANPRSEISKLRSQSQSPLQKSQSGSALSSLIEQHNNHHHHHIPVYTPGQHSELSTAFLHKQKRGGNVRKHGDVIAIDRPLASSTHSTSPPTSPNSITTSASISSPTGSITSPLGSPAAATSTSAPSVTTTGVTTGATTSGPVGSVAAPASPISPTSQLASINSKPFMQLVPDYVTSSSPGFSPVNDSNDSDNITIKASPSTSEDDDDDSPEANQRRQQKMIRKKSGELVKSSLKLPSLLRTQSMPIKMVHFDSKLEHVRKFFRRERPTAVSSGSTTPVKEKVSFQWASGSSTSDSETDSDYSSDSEEEDDGLDGDASEDDDIETIRGAVASHRRSIAGSISGAPKKHLRHHQKKIWQIALPNFNSENSNQSDKMVYLDSVFLSSDNNNLIGHICVKNVSYRKNVSVRYTVDFWKSVTDVVADYNGDVRRKTLRSGYDRFTFSIRLADLPQAALTSNSMFFCVRYQSDDGDFWDNNNSLNYEVLLTRVPKHAADHTSSGTVKPAKTHTKQQPTMLDDDMDEIDKTTFKSAPRQASSYFMYQPNQPAATNAAPHHGRNGGLKHHHRRNKTDPSPDFLYDNDFDHHHSVEDTADLFDGLTVGPKQDATRATGNVSKTGSYNSSGTGSFGNSGNSFGSSNNKPSISNSFGGASNFSPTKKSNGLTSRYSFGASLNAALARNNMTGRRSSYDVDGEADEEVTTSESTSDDESTDTTPVDSSNLSTPQLRSFIFPKTNPRNSMLIRPHSSTDVTDESSRPAWDSLSYKDIINKYCFFQDTPVSNSSSITPTGTSAASNKNTAAATGQTGKKSSTMVHNHHHHSHSMLPHHHQSHPRPAGSYIPSPMTTSPALIPQSFTPPIVPQSTSVYSAQNASSSPLLAAAAATLALNSPPESSSSTPSGSFSPSPTDTPGSPGESSSDTLLDVSEPRKIWHSVEV